MRRAIGLPGSLAVLIAVAAALALTASPQPAAATTAETGEPVETITSELEPGWNLAGWTEAAAPVETIFERIPELQVVYAWDADFQRFRLAMRADPSGHSDLQKLTPGMGLWLLVAGDEPVTWARPIIAEAAYAPLREGWNLVIWGGEDGIASRTALRDIDDILTTALDVNSRWPLELRTGEAYWLDVSRPREWNQVYQPPRIEFLAAFSQQKQDQVRAHVDDVVEFFFQRLGFRVPGVLVRYGDPEQFGCSGYYDAPLINLGDCLDVFAHEYVHAIQQHLTGGGTHPPLWLREGDANFWAAVYDDARGKQDYSQWLRELVLPLARLEGFVPRGFTYHSYHIRVHVLVKREGTERLGEFYRQTARIGDWQLAFEETYGMTFDEFNVVFAQEMLVAPQPSQGCPVEWFEPKKTRDNREVCRTIEGRLTDLAGNPRIGVDVGAYAGPIATFTAFFEARGPSGADGSFSLSVPAGTYLLSLLPPSADGWVYYRENGALTAHRNFADSITASRSDVTDMMISYGVLSGVVLDEEGLQIPGLQVVRHIGQHGAGKRAEGEFTFFVGRGLYKLEFQCGGRTIGWYDGESGLVLGESRAAEIVMEDADRTDIMITVPSSVSCE